MKTTTLTRQQLYDRVWSKPVDQLAKDWGVASEESATRVWFEIARR